MIILSTNYDALAIRNSVLWYQDSGEGYCFLRYMMSYYQGRLIKSVKDSAMPIIIDLDRAIFEWQAKHGERMTYAELARRADITLPTLHRLKSGDLIHPDMRKINAICKVLECEPGDLLKREDTAVYEGKGGGPTTTAEEIEAFEEEVRRIDEEEQG